MRSSLRVVFLAGSLLLFAAPAAVAQGQGQEWKPPTRQMPSMPSRSDLGGDWLSARNNWFQGVEGVSGVAPGRMTAAGEPRAEDQSLQVVRFMSGPIPAVVWSDRNGDGRADVIEIFRSGGVIIQLIDADYDGSANVMRVYDATGKLLREERM